MNRLLQSSLFFLAVALSMLVCGCKPARPSVTEVAGRVLLDGKPLPHAQVEFVPDLAHFGAEMNAMGITDKEGNYRLTCFYKQQPGAAVGKHRVIVTEAPMPDEFRQPEAQGHYAYYLRSLANRPIPAVYGSAGGTPLRVEVKPDQKTYDLPLAR